MRQKAKNHRWIVLSLSAGLLGVAAAEPPCAEARCSSASLPGPVELPDGQVHEGEQLRVCVVRESSGGRAWHEVSVDGEPLGVYLGRTRNGSSTEGFAASMLFERREPGALRLVGYVHPVSPTGQALTVFGTRYRSVMSVNIEAVERASQSDELVSAESEPPTAMACSL